MSRASDPKAAGLYREGRYLAQNPTWHVEDGTWKAAQIKLLLERNQLDVGSICEVGCGAGGVIRSLSDRIPSATCVGYDISPQALELAKPLESPALTFHLGDVTEISGKYDVLLVVDVIEHLEDYFSFLRLASRVSEYAMFHIPLEATVQGVLRPSRFMASRNTVGHLHFFTKEIALAGLKDAGYEVIDWRFTAGAVDLPTRSLKARLARLPRRALFRVDPDFAVRTLGGYSLLALARGRSSVSIL